MGFLCFFNGLRAHIELLARAAFVHFVRFVRPGWGSSPGWPGALWQPLGRAWEGPGTEGPQGAFRGAGTGRLVSIWRPGPGSGAISVRRASGRLSCISCVSCGPGLGPARGQFRRLGLGKLRFQLILVRSAQIRGCWRARGFRALIQAISVLNAT